MIRFHKLLLVFCAHYLISQPLMAQPFAFVTNNGVDATGTTVTPIDLATNIPQPTITVGEGPTGIAITPNGLFAYVPNFTSDNVTVFNTMTSAIVTTIDLAPQVGPTYIAITPDGTKAYVSNSVSNTVSVIDTATYVASTITLTGIEPQGIAVTPDGTRVFVAFQGSANVGVINTATELQIATISLAVGSEPFAIAITPNGEFAYVTDIVNGTLTPITIATDTAGTPIVLSATTSPEGIAITPNGEFAYVTNLTNNNVTPVTIATNTPGTPIALGAGTAPFGIAITQDGTLAYVVQQGTNSVRVIDLLTNTPTGTITGVGPSPLDIAIAPIAVLPPSSFTGFIQQNKFLNVTECVLTMQWTASPSTNVVSYEIFRNGVLFATIPATGSLLFTAGLSCNDTGAGFTIVAVDSTGMASTPVPLVLVPAPVTHNT